MRAGGGAPRPERVPVPAICGSLAPVPHLIRTVPCNPGATTNGRAPVVRDRAPHTGDGLPTCADSRAHTLAEIFQRSSIPLRGFANREDGTPRAGWRGRTDRMEEPMGTTTRVGLLASALLAWACAGGEATPEAGIDSRAAVSDVGAERTDDATARDVRDSRSFGDRLLPPHRPVAETCVDPSPIDPTNGCLISSPARGSLPEECAVNADCAEATPLCLATHDFSSFHGCVCHAVACLSDADCPQGTLCLCGEVDNTGEVQDACGGWRARPCSHRCVPAACRVDADCGPGRLCSPSYDECGWQVVSYHCHDPARDLCLTSADCVDPGTCRFSPDDGWYCEPIRPCD